MVKSIRQTGKNVEIAIEEALAKLSATRDQVEINVIDEGNRGILGLIGSREAVVEITVKENVNKIDRAIGFLQKVTKTMNLDVEIEAIKDESDEEQVTLNIIGENLGILIGHRGNTLDSLQYLTSLVANRDEDETYVRIILDAEGYRERRKKTLFQLARRLADKARTTGRKVVLEPMPPHERRIIHLALQEEKDIKTYSEGREPYRKVIITATN